MMGCNYLTRQGMFDMVVRKALKQTTKNNGWYIKSDGSKCFIGHILIEEFYDEAIEAQTINELFEEGLYLDVFSNSRIDVTDSDNKEFLDYLQDIHDNYLLTDWPEELIQLAHEFSLDYSLVYKTLVETTEEILVEV